MLHCSLNGALRLVRLRHLWDLSVGLGFNVAILLFWSRGLVLGDSVLNTTLLRVLSACAEHASDQRLIHFFRLEIRMNSPAEQESMVGPFP